MGGIHCTTDWGTCAWNKVCLCNPLDSSPYFGVLWWISKGFWCPSCSTIATRKRLLLSLPSSPPNVGRSNKEILRRKPEVEFWVKGLWAQFSPREQNLGPSMCSETPCSFILNGPWLLPPHPHLNHYFAPGCLVDWRVWFSFNSLNSIDFWPCHPPMLCLAQR